MLFMEIVDTQINTYLLDCLTKAKQHPAVRVELQISTQKHNWIKTSSVKEDFFGNYLINKL